MTPRILVPIALHAASALALAGCSGAGGPAASGDGKVAVVASTNVYGDIAEAIGGDRVDVTALIDSVAQDPHSYEASARRLRDAVYVLENNGLLVTVVGRGKVSVQSIAPGTRIIKGQTITLQLS